MKSIFPLLLIIHSAVILFSCRDDRDDDSRPSPPAPVQKEEQLPPVTSTGAGTFGCRVNGKVWVAKNKGSFPHVYASFDKSNDNLVNVVGNQIDNPSIFYTIGLQFFHNPTISSYPLYLFNYKGNSSVGASFIDATNNKFWKTDSLTGGYVIITRLDRINQIISGVFHFDCINTESHDTLHITDGRFDMNFLY